MTLGFDETLSRLEGELFSDSTVMAVPQVPDAVDASAEVGHTHLHSSISRGPITSKPYGANKVNVKLPFELL